jgi:hypothetical protein
VVLVWLYPSEIITGANAETIVAVEHESNLLDRGVVIGFAIIAVAIEEGVGWLRN